MAEKQPDLYKKMLCLTHIGLWIGILSLLTAVVIGVMQLRRVSTHVVKETTIIREVGKKPTQTNDKPQSQPNNERKETKKTATEPSMPKNAPVVTPPDETRTPSGGKSSTTPVPVPGIDGVPPKPVDTAGGSTAIQPSKSPGKTKKTKK